MKQKTRFKKTEIGIIPENWEIKELDGIVTKLGDGLHGTPKYDNNGDYFFINGNNLVNGGIKITNNTRKCSNKEFEKYKKELNDRTILVSINGTLGNISFYNNEKVILGKSACYFNLKNNIDKSYIKYVLLGSFFQNYIQLNATGTVIKNMPLKRMREFELPFPPLSEQKAIAKILSDLDSKIETLQKQNETLEKIGQLLFKRWFVDFEFPDEDGKGYKLNAGEMIESEMGEIPAGWKVGKLGEETNVSIGRTPPRKESVWFSKGEGMKWISIKDMGGYNIFADKTSEYLTNVVSSLQDDLAINNISNITINNSGSVSPVTLNQTDDHTFTAQIQTHPGDPEAMLLSATGIQNENTERFME